MMEILLMKNKIEQIEDHVYNKDSTRILEE